MKILKSVLLVVVLLVILISGGVYIWIMSGKPQIDGKASIPGLKQPVTVLFDAYGVPHIKAENMQDAYTALGYVHAQDRLFQMEMLRRLASGRLAEVLGPDLLKVDKLFRTLGIKQFAAENAKQFLGADTAEYQQAALAYLNGVNAFVAKGKKPIEFSIIGIPMQSFTREDIFLVAGYMAFSFAEAIRVDPTFQKINEQYPGYLEAAFGVRADIVRSTNRNKSWLQANRFSEKFSTELHTALSKIPVPLMIGSNGWVIAGSKTKSGKPILANDTHIGFAQPAVWYEAQLEYPGYNFYGHHIAGIPFGVLGNNDFCAWGITMFENDDMDFYQETIHPDSANLVKHGMKWEPLVSRTEIIKVSGKPDVLFNVTESTHGPIINGVLEGVDSVHAPVALWWSALKRPATLIKSFYELNHANTFQSARNAVSEISAPGLNIIYADTTGTIAWWAAASLPIRNERLNDLARFFHDGASGLDDHLEYYPFEKNPQAVNPPWGYIHTGNNQPDSVNGVIYPGYYYPRDRAGRIEQLLKEKNNWTMEEAAAMQLDHKSITAPETSATIAAVIGEGELAEILRNWDGNHGLKDAGPAVYYNMLSQIIYGAMADEIGAAALKDLLGSSVMRNSFNLFLANDSTGWWDNIQTPEKETRKEIFLHAAERTEALLKEKCGPNPADWQWGKIHYLKHNHPLGAIKLFDGIFSVGSFPVTGGNEVINNLMFDLDTTGVFPVLAGPALRKVSDLSDLSKGITVSPTGQSGVLGSSFYKDEAKMYAEGKTRPMLMRVGESDAKVSVLMLEP
jgi:penicillin amidase